MNRPVWTRGRIGAVARALVVCILALGPVQAEGIRLDALKIPVPNPGGAGPSTALLDAIVLRPDDGLPHPLVLLNHGSPRSASDRPSMSPYGMWAQATEFARRGWVAVAFLRRGYGVSQGGWAETYGQCSDPDYAKAGRAGATDIAAAAKFMTGQAYVSKGKWISVGRSAGGFATVALTSTAPSGLAAAIVFAPGRGSTGPDTVCEEGELVDAFAQFGKSSRIPLLWVSADNDHFFGPQLVTRLSDAFAKSGGKLSLVRTPAFGSDGHALFNESGTAIWAPIVDRFLRDNNLVLRDRLLDAPPRPAQLRSR
ncbi:alpha/beta hydrolase family protein [Bradyrhizobium viridifuturi]|uniref:alpha/beta hydrolase family protein n=1 Tax=Bradyrhizobium viridifuturi TaxID=1654716 RepID=UPI00067F46F5|nr:CocE/NonD family hydrolase [Bradyrhizobium viridifuturi]